MYLESFELPSVLFEEIFLGRDIKIKQTCYASHYPFQIFPQKHLSELKFSPVTFFYGGNGSGKTTLLNVIAEALHLDRGTYFNRSAFFEDFVSHCEFYTPRYSSVIPKESRMIASDDVFDYLLDIRSMNEQIDDRREDLFQEYRDEKYSSFQMQSIADYEKLRKHNDAKRLTTSKYVNHRLMKNLPEKSNGESAFSYFTEHIKENALYLLDEPENSLAVDRQLELRKFIEDSARYFHCQFIIATHSPFLLSMKQSSIYDLDEDPVTVKKWTELKNVKAYFDFFMEHQTEFS